MRDRVTPSNYTDNSAPVVVVEQRSSTVEQATATQDSLSLPLPFLSEGLYQNPPEEPVML